MAERTAITQVIQVGVETTPGTTVPATVVLSSMDIESKVMNNTDIFRPTGFKYPTVAAQEREWLEGTMKGQPTYTELVYPLSSVIQKNPPTQQMDGATPTTVWRWIFESHTSAPDTAATFSVEQGSSVLAHGFSNGVFSEYSLNFTREKVDMGGKLLGTALISPITMTPSLSAIPLIPIQATQLTVFLDNTSAGLGTTKMPRLFDFKYDLTNRYGPVWVVDASQPSYVAVVELVPKQTVKVIVEADAAGMALLQLLRNDQTRFMRVLAKGATLYNAGTYAANPLTYRYQQDMAVKVTEVGTFSDQQGVYAIEFTFEVFHDATWGKAAHFEIDNTIQSL